MADYLHYGIEFPDDKGLQKIIESLAQDKPWIFERFRG